MININGIDLFGKESHCDFNIKKSFITANVKDMLVDKVIGVDKLESVVIEAGLESGAFPHGVIAQMFDMQRCVLLWSDADTDLSLCFLFFGDVSLLVIFFIVYFFGQFFFILLIGLVIVIVKIHFVVLHDWMICYKKKVN